MNLHVLQDSRKRLEGHGKSWQGLRWHHFQLCQKPPCPPRLHGKTWRVLTGFKIFDLSGKIPVSELQSCSCYLGLAIWSHYLDLAIPVLLSLSHYLSLIILISLSRFHYLNLAILVLLSWSHFLNLTIPVLLSHSLSWSCYLKLAISILLSRSPQSCYLNLTIAILLSQSCYCNLAIVILLLRSGYRNLATSISLSDKVGNGVRGLGQPIGSFPESFIKIEYLEPCQDSQCPFDPFWSLGGHGGSWQSWKWCQRTRRNPRKLHKKFRQNRTTGSLLNANFCKNYGLWGAVFCP